MKRRLSAIVLLLASASVATADNYFCPLEEWMSGAYVLYYCDYYPEKCGENIQANYWYGEPVQNVPYTECDLIANGGHCLTEAHFKAKGGQPFPGLPRAVTADYQHILPEGCNGDTRRHSEAIDAGCVVYFGEEEARVYAKLFIFKVTRPEQPTRVRYVAMEVREDQIDTERAEPVTVAPVPGTGFVFHGKLQGQGLLVLTARRQACADEEGGD